MARVKKYILKYVDDLGNENTTQAMTKSTMIDNIIILYNNNCKIIDIKESK